MGAESNLSYASSYSSQKLAESQVFIPERIDFDDVINHCFVQNKNELDCPLWRYVSTGPQLVSAEELRLAMKQLESLGALTINHSIDIANELFGLNMSKYDDEWADLPISLVKTMAQNNTFVLEAIQNVEEVVQSARSDSGDQGGRPESSTKPTPLVGNAPKQPSQDKLMGLNKDVSSRLCLGLCSPPPLSVEALRGVSVMILHIHRGNPVVFLV